MVFFSIKLPELTDLMCVWIIFKSTTIVGRQIYRRIIADRLDVKLFPDALRNNRHL